jgi:hypothetical protein
MAVGASVFRIRIEMILRRCWNLVTPSRSATSGDPPCFMPGGPVSEPHWREFPCALCELRHLVLPRINLPCWRFLPDWDPSPMAGSF